MAVFEHFEADIGSHPGLASGIELETLKSQVGQYAQRLSEECI